MIGALSLPPLTDADAASLGPDEARERERFRDADLGDRPLAGLRLEECELLDVSLHGADLRGARLVESRLARVNAPVLRAPRSSWRDVVVEQCRVGSGELSGSSWQSVVFRGCKLGYLNLREADLADVELVDCAVEELDLDGAQVARLAFSGVEITTLSVEGARLEDVDLRGAETGGVRGLASLRGATISERQLTRLAPLLAAHLGIALAAEDPRRS